MIIIRTVADLRRVLGAYDDNLPVSFVSSETGGNWPHGHKSRAPMAVTVDDQIHEIHDTISGDRRLVVALLLARERPAA